MIEKMKFLTISGPKEDIDRMWNTYLSGHEIQLENAVSELKTTETLLPFAEANPYSDPQAKAQRFVDMLKSPDTARESSASDEKLIQVVEEVDADYQQLMSKGEELNRQRKTLQDELSLLEPYRPLDIDLAKARDYQFVKVRFGRIAGLSYRRLMTYLADDLDAVFIESTRNVDYVYGCYFVANTEAGLVDTSLSAMHFEQVSIPGDVSGTPGEACDQLTGQIQELNGQVRDNDEAVQKLLQDHAEDLLAANERLTRLAHDFDIRKLAARRQDAETKKEYYVLCGWMGAEDTVRFQEDIKGDKNVRLTVDSDQDADKYFGDPPTKLKNPRLFKPYEMYTRMYGLPNYHEIDPTIFMAVTYSVIFGAMFGDVGQGLCLFIGGGILYLVRKMDLAGIISLAGIFSTFFGFMYGSVFGFDNVLKAVWLKPADAMMKLPFVGQLNTVFVVSIAVGMGLNLLLMVFQIINAARAGDLENMLFSSNGVAGFVFYGFLVLTIVLYMSGHHIPADILLVIFLGVPVLCFLFKEPLGNLVERNHKKIEGGAVMFLVEGIFELIETMLSYFSNTLSYVRIGAFAISHGAMMSVVMMLTGVEAGNPNWIGVVIGNLIVMGMEGLVVGIQVLRLEYYEMFSRYYKGDGKEFIPFSEPAVPKKAGRRKEKKAGKA